MAGTFVDLVRRLDKDLPPELLDEIVRQFVLSFGVRVIKLLRKNRVKISLDERTFTLRHLDFERVAFSVLEVVFLAAERSRQLYARLVNKLVDQTAKTLVWNSVLMVKPTILPAYPIPFTTTKHNFTLSPPSIGHIPMLCANLRHVDLTIVIPNDTNAGKGTEYLWDLLLLEKHLPTLKLESLNHDHRFCD